MTPMLPSGTRKRFQGEEGASLVEYGLLVSLIVLVCAAALGYFQDETSSSLCDSASAIGDGTGGTAAC